MLLGLLVSAVLGAVESQLLLHKTAQYKENMYWKYMIVFFVIAMGYVIWVYGSESYQPILPNTAKFIARVMLLSIPYILTFGGLVIFCYTLLILRRAINKKKLGRQK